MPRMVPVMPAMREADRLKLNAGNASRDIQSSLALHADRLQRVGIGRPTTQKAAAAADADRRIATDAAIGPCEFAASEPGVRRVDGPFESGLLGDAEIDADPAQRRDIGFGTAALALEYALEAGHRTDHEADILAAVALQNAGANRRPRIGALNRRTRGNDGDKKCRASHVFISPRNDLNGARATGRKRRVQNKALSKKVPSKDQGAGGRCDLTRLLPMLLTRTGVHVARERSISTCHKSAGCACRRLRDRRSSPHRKCGTPDQARTPNPAPPRRLRPPAAR